MTSRPHRPLAAALALFGLLAGLGAATALGHADLDTVTPTDKATVTTPPSEVVMTFTEPLNPAKSSIRLVDTSSKVVAEGSTVDAADPKTMRLVVPAALPMGTYTARWTSASALDGDLDHGTTSFTTGAVGPIPGTPVPSAASAPPSAAASIVPSLAPSLAPSPAPSSSAPPTTPAASTSDAVIPIVVALIVLAGLGVWLLRGRARGR